MSSSWARVAICWAMSVAWMPWNSPSSQPTSWAWAIRSSASDGVSPSLKGSVIRSSSSRSSGARPSSSSRIEAAWMLVVLGHRLRRTLDRHRLRSHHVHPSVRCRAGHALHLTAVLGGSLIRRHGHDPTGPDPQENPWRFPDF